MKPARVGRQSHFWRTPSLNVFRFRCHADLVVRPKCHPEFMELPAPRRSPRCWRCRSPRLRAAVRRCRPGNANPAAREPAAAADRPERGAAIPQPAARGAPEGAAGRRASRTRRAAIAAAQPSIAAAPPAQPQSAAAAAPAGPAEASRLPRRRRSSRSRRRACRRRRAGAVAMPSIPARIRMPRARRGARRRPAADSRRGAGRRSRRPRGGRAARSGEHRRAAQSARRLAAAAAASPGAGATLTTLAAVGDPEGRVRSRHRLYAAQGLCAGRRDHAQLRAEIPRAIP